MSRFPSGVRFQTTYAHSSNYTNSSWTKNFIVIHWWDNPAKRPQFDGIVSWFRNPSANVSCQYVVEANRIAQMTPESAYAWHAGSTQGNRHGIGIEVNPRLSAGDYETTAVLVAEIWRRRGKKLPLRRHREFTTTNCPGTLDVARVQRRAEQIYSGSSSTPASSSTPSNSGGKTVATPRQIWSYGNKNIQKGRQAFNFLRSAAADSEDVQKRIRRADWRRWVANGVRSFRIKPDPALLKRWPGLRKDGFTLGYWIQAGYLQARMARQNSAEAFYLSRDNNEMIKAMAGVLDENLQTSGKIFDAVTKAQTAPQAMSVMMQEIEEDDSAEDDLEDTSDDETVVEPEEVEEDDIVDEDEED